MEEQEFISIVVALLSSNKANAGRAGEFKSISPRLCV
jgi:hypothetical protein